MLYIETRCELILEHIYICQKFLKKTFMILYKMQFNACQFTNALVLFQNFLGT